jgi:hypothetical protein
MRIELVIEGPEAEQALRELLTHHSGIRLAEEPQQADLHTEPWETERFRASLVQAEADIRAGKGVSLEKYRAKKGL